NGRHELEVADAQRLERALVDVGDVAVANLEMVDLQRVDGLQRVLPAALLHRGWVGDLLPRLRQVEVDFGLFELDVADGAPIEQSGPVGPRAQARDAEQRT